MVELPDIMGVLWPLWETNLMYKKSAVLPIHGWRKKAIYALVDKEAGPNMGSTQR